MREEWFFQVPQNENMITKEFVVLVTPQDQEIGLMEKLQAHKEGALHRAISVCLFDEERRWLLQRRALTKYHSPGLLANSCCSHPRQGETPLDAASRRIYEELRINYSQDRLEHVSTFIYREDVGQGLIEHEKDYLFVGKILASDIKIPPNPDEVHEILWVTDEEIQSMMEKTPELFTKWFFHIYRELKRASDKVSLLLSN